MLLEKVVELLLAIALAIGGGGGVSGAAERVGAVAPPDVTVPSEPAEPAGHEPATDEHPDEDAADGLATAIARITEILERLQAHLATVTGDEPASGTLDGVRGTAPSGLEFALEILVGLAGGEGKPDGEAEGQDEPVGGPDDGPPIELPIPLNPGPPVGRP